MASNNVLVGAPATATGGILAAPAGTTGPVDPTTALDAAFVALGLVGEDGVTQTTERNIERIRAWGGDVVRTVTTEHGVTFTFQFLETDSTVMAEVYGADNVDLTAATTSSGSITAVTLKASTLPIKAYVFEMKDGDGRIRISLPAGQITEVGDVTYVHSDAVRYEVTIEALPDVDGVKAYIYVLNDDALVSP